jgi:hexosaminidase
VRAQSAAGLFYGVQSLLQMAAANQARAGSPILLPAVTLTDAPRFEWRGLMLDESRHFFGKQTVKELLDVMAMLKLNRFHWHLTDEPGWRIEIKKHPKLTQIGGQGNWSDANGPARFYTQKDIREIVAYATARHIMVIPEIDMPGHATAATRAYPELSGGGEGKWAGFTFNPAKEETYQFLEDVLREVAALFPAPYIHLGGDEVHYGNQSWSTDPTIVQFTRDHGMTNAVQLEQYFVRRMAGVIQRLGKTTMGWDEIAGAGVPPANSAVMWWRHDRPQVLTQLLERDYRVVLCPRLPLYFDFVQDESHQHGRRWKGEFNPLADVYRFPRSEIEALVPPGKDAHVLGIEACLWTERIQHRERLAFMTYPRLAAMAEAAWTPEAVKDTTSFNRRLPAFLRELQRRGIPYFNPFEPRATPEPPGPDKKATGTANG